MENPVTDARGMIKAARDYNADIDRAGWSTLLVCKHVSQPIYREKKENVQGAHAYI